MELRVLEYFLAVAREESITGAAQSLHLSQPTLSRQLKDLEEELGKQLMIRGGRKIILTEEGMILRKRAEEILNLVEKTETEITLSNQITAGDVYIGAGETEAVHFLTQAARKMQKEYPLIRYHIASGDSVNVTEQLDKGLIDFGLLFAPFDTKKYDFLPLPTYDTWGVIMRRDNPLAAKETICPEDLTDKPLIISRRIMDDSSFTKWFGQSLSSLNVIATYNLAFNASLMAEDNLGYVITLDRIINTSRESNLCFRPLNPGLKAHMSLVWKKYQIFSKPAKKYLQTLEALINHAE